jgi:branched-subunit amino acid transport protein
MTALVVMLLLAVACYAMRSLFVLAVPAECLPARLQEGLAQLAPAVLAALVAAELAGAADGAGPLTTAVVVSSMLVAALAVRLTGSLTLALGVGLVGALVVDLLLG